MSHDLRTRVPRIRRVIGAALLVFGATGGAIAATVAVGATSPASTWTVPTSNTPPIGTQLAQYNNVSCTSTSSCVAVGSYYPGSHDIGLISTTTDGGSTWSNAISDSAGTKDELHDVACAVSGNCVAVGQQGTGSGVGTLFLETSSMPSTSWTYDSSVIPPAATNNQDEFLGVSCSGTTCVAVGYYDPSGQYEPLIQFSASSGNAGTWANATLPASTTALTGGPSVNDVACTTSSHCVAVGYDSVGPSTLILTSDNSGSSWTHIQAGLPSFPNSGTPQLEGISCSTTTSCIAVGQYGASGFAWQTADGGTTWNDISSSIPVVSGSNAFSSVSCSGSTCAIVGTHGTFPANKEIAFTSNDAGVTWAASTVASPDSSQDAFSGVACISSQCIAGGYDGYTGSAQNALIERTTIPTLPGAPTDASATAGDANASVSFGAPSSSGTSPVTSYTVTSSPDGVTATGSTSPITVSGLTNGRTYTFTVTASSVVGTGPASSSSNAVTPTAPIVVTTTPPPTPTTTPTTTMPVVTTTSVPITTTSILISTASAPSPKISTTTTIVNKGRAPIGLTCPKGTCTGTAQLTTTVQTKKKVGKKTITVTVTVILATAHYSVKSGKRATTVSLILTTAGKAVFTHATTKKPVKSTLQIAVTKGKTTKKSISVT